MGAQIDLFISHRPPKALDKNVVPPDAAAVYANGDRVLQQRPGEGRHDNIFVERLWWTVKQEWVYLPPVANGLEQKRSLAEFFDWYNRRRPHQALGWQTPGEAYFGRIAPVAAEAA